jgi:hypothetical protein
MVGDKQCVTGVKRGVRGELKGEKFSKERRKN